MSIEDRTLYVLVEGEADRSFFEMICKKLKFRTSVKIKVPKNFGLLKNSKEGVFNTFPHMLNVLKSEDEDNRLAAIVDADYGNNNGYNHAIETVTKIVAPYGFTLKPDPIAGVLFEHDDGLADFGLWVMPNNSNEGMLEDWIKSCVHPDEHELFTHAQEVVDTLPQTKFQHIHISKAEVATWLAWQKKPGHGLYRIVEDELIDANSTPHRELSAWLNHIYNTEDK